MSNSMFYTGLSGLSAAQAALVTTGHNTANVNTAGYTRQSAQISSSGGLYKPGVGFFGNGAKVNDVSRNYDQYLTTQLNQAQTANQSLNTYYTQISQIDNLLADPKAGLAPLMQKLFAGAQAVADTPADPAARQQLLNSAETMANQFRTMASYLNGLSTNVDDQISGSVQQINTYASQIANLNKQIAILGNAAGGQAPNDLLDQRDQLVNDLSKIVGVKVVVQDGGQYNLFIGNGQTLVLGDKAGTLKAVTSAADPGRAALAFVNAAGNAIEVRDSNITGGSLGGLLQFRNEALSTSQNSLGRIAIALSDTFNAQQNLGIDLNGVLGGDFFSQADPVVVNNTRNAGSLVLTPAFSDTSKLTTSDYRLEIGGAAGALTYTLTRLSDNQPVALPAGFPAAPAAATFDGLTISASGGAAQPGDAFLIQPTRNGARDLSVLIADPAKVAAASPILTDNTAGNKGNAAIGTGSIDASYPAAPLAAKLTLAYDSATATLSGFPAGATVTVTLPDGTSNSYTNLPVPYTSGASIAFNGIKVSISGQPSNLDTFTIDRNTGGVQDGSNALRLAALQNRKTIGDGTASFKDGYAQLVSSVGNKGRQLQISNTAQTSLTAQIRSAQQSVSGVNQDEETANLLMFQQMYQANAKVIQTASTLFDAVLSINS